MYQQEEIDKKEIDEQQMDEQQQDFEEVDANIIASLQDELNQLQQSNNNIEKQISKQKKELKKNNLNKTYVDNHIQEDLDTNKLNMTYAYDYEPYFDADDLMSDEEQKQKYQEEKKQKNAQRKNEQIQDLKQWQVTQNFLTDNKKQNKNKEKNTKTISYLGGGILIVTKDQQCIPKKGSKQAAGYDLFSIEDTTIQAWSHQHIDTGIQIQVPVGHYGKIEARSGLAFKHNLQTGAGVIDSDYTGTVKVKIYNFSDNDYKIQKYERIAQIIFHRHYDFDFFQVDELEQTQRGNNGFGSTGKK